MDTEDEVGCVALIFWGFSVLFSLGLVGVAVWAIIKLVNHVTG